MSAWDDWSPHDEKGFSYRERYVVQENLNGGRECPTSRQTKLGMLYLIR